MPHLKHIFVLMTVEPAAAVLADVTIGVRIISSRSGKNGRRGTYCRGASAGGVADVHTVSDIDPYVPSNAKFCVAIELT